MEIRQLRYFTAVAQTLNFSEAARRLYITQGTLSQQIQQLEFEVGSQLFDRSSHSVSLTEAGEELLPLALETISASEACITRMNDLKGALAGTLSIGSIGTFKGIVLDAAGAFIRQYPGVNLTIQITTVEQLISMLRERKIDIALAYKAVSENEDIEYETLFKTSLQILMRKGHPLAGEKNLTLEQLASYGMIRPGRGLQARNAFDKLIGIDTRKLNVRVDTNDPDVAMDLIMKSNLLAISSPLPAADRSDIVKIPLEAHRYQMNCCIHRLKSTYRKKSSELFLDMLRDSADFERFALDLKK